MNVVVMSPGAVRSATLYERDQRHTISVLTKVSSFQNEIIRKLEAVNSFRNGSIRVDY